MKGGGLVEYDYAAVGDDGGEVNVEREWFEVGAFCCERVGRLGVGGERGRGDGDRCAGGNDGDPPVGDGVWVSGVVGR